MCGFEEKEEIATQWVGDALGDAGVSWDLSGEVGEEAQLGNAVEAP